MEPPIGQKRRKGQGKGWRKTQKRERVDTRYQIGGTEKNERVLTEQGGGTVWSGKAIQTDLTKSRGDGSFTKKRESAADQREKKGKEATTRNGKTDQRPSPRVNGVGWTKTQHGLVVVAGGGNREKET